MRWNLLNSLLATTRVLGTQADPKVVMMKRDTQNCSEETTTYPASPNEREKDEPQMKIDTMSEWYLQTTMKKTTTYTQLYLSNTHITIYQSCCRGIPSLVSWSTSRADESWWLLYTTQLVWLCIYDASQICADTSYAKTTALILIKEASVIATQHLKFFWASSQLYINNITVVII